MSSINPDELKSPSDLSIPFLTRPLGFTITQIRIDSLQEFGKLIKSFKIVNDDALSNVTYRTQSPSGTLRTIPPNSDDSADEWTSYLEINPNAVSGTGSFEIDLVNINDAKKPLDRQVKEPKLF